jgi:hypothetical protein
VPDILRIDLKSVREQHAAKTFHNISNTIAGKHRLESKWILLKRDD